MAHVFVVNRQVQLDVIWYNEGEHRNSVIVLLGRCGIQEGGSYCS